MAISDNPILTDDQKSILTHFRASRLVERFYLTGGTALSAFFLYQRLSEDLDFFSQEPVGIEDVLAFMKSLPEVREVQYERKYDRKIFLIRYPSSRTMKVEFTTYPFSRLERGPEVEKIQIDSLRDILANKLMALTDRRDAKDYVDLYYAIKRHPQLDIDQLIVQAELKFGVKGVQHILRGRFLEPIPSIRPLKMRETLEQEDLTQFFVQRAKHWIARSTQEEP